MGGLEEGKNKQNKQRANPAVIGALASAIGLGGAAVAQNPELQDRLSTVAGLTQNETFDAMQMRIAKAFAKRLSAEFEKGEQAGRVDENAVTKLFTEYLYEKSPMQYSGGSIAPLNTATIIVKLERAQVAMAQWGGIHKGALDFLNRALEDQKKKIAEKPAPAAPTMPDAAPSSSGSADSYADSGSDSFEIPEIPDLSVDPNRPRQI